jgi:hypothetical protein
LLGEIEASMSDSQRPRVGLGCLIFNSSGHVLIGKRCALAGELLQLENRGPHR